jgi:hypothetical protein
MQLQGTLIYSESMRAMADTYKILSQSQSQEINPSGTGFMEVWNITFSITSGPAKGNTGSVQVSAGDHNAAHVKTVIDAKVKDLSEIASLGS